MKIENPFQLVDNYRLNATEFPPRTLASLTDNTDCRLFGWGETGAELPRYETVRIRSPQNCNASLPRAFCTQFDAQFPAQCHAILGSPVVCGDGSVVSGFLVGSNGECVSTGNRTELFYHSVGQFQEWIERVTSAGTTDQISVLLSLSAFLVTLKNIL